MEITQVISEAEEPVFCQDGHGTYLVELDIIGCENRIFIKSPGDSEEEAIEIALETVELWKNNDISVESIRRLGVT